MSLDVYLEAQVLGSRPRGSGVFVREEGQRIREISREDWDARFPGAEPVVVRTSDEDDEASVLYQNNITHNLNRMAEAAGLYTVLWKPGTLEIQRAEQLIPHLQKGLDFLRDQPDLCKGYNPGNGWGAYEDLVAFVRSYLHACQQHPNATVRVST